MEPKDLPSDDDRRGVERREIIFEPVVAIFERAPCGINGESDKVDERNGGRKPPQIGSIGLQDFLAACRLQFHTLFRHLIHPLNEEIPRVKNALRGSVTIMNFL